MKNLLIQNTDRGDPVFLYKNEFHLPLITNLDIRNSETFTLDKNLAWTF